jgi:SSS family solute:Na+ symporter
MAMAHWELHAWVMILLGWVFVPFYYQSGVFTMPEFLERRFNARARWVLSIVSPIAYVFTKVSVTVWAGAIVFRTLLPDTFGSPENAFWVGAFATVILAGIYTVFGGLRAVLFTDSVQAFILLVGACFITFIGLDKLGGWGELRSFCSQDVAKYALWRPLSDPGFPWLGILIASPVVGIWYWCTDQYIVQRTLAAKDLMLDFTKIAKAASQSPDVIPVAVQNADTMEVILVVGTEGGRGRSGVERAYQGKQLRRGRIPHHARHLPRRA